MEEKSEWKDPKSFFFAKTVLFFFLHLVWILFSKTSTETTDDLNWSCVCTRALNLNATMTTTTCNRMLASSSILSLMLWNCILMLDLFPSSHFVFRFAFVGMKCLLCDFSFPFNLSFSCNIRFCHRTKITSCFSRRFVRKSKTNKRPNVVDDRASLFDADMDTFFIDGMQISERIVISRLHTNGRQYFPSLFFSRTHFFFLFEFSGTFRWLS